MSKVLSVASGKGGVGKTTVVSNLGALLTELGKDVVLVDGNLSTANLSLHLGIPLYPVTLHDVLKGDAMMPEAMYVHPSGMKVVPSGIGIDDLEGTDSRDLPIVVDELVGESDMVLLDTAAGLGQETISTLEASDELLLVTHPNLPSLTDVLKTKNLAEGLGVKVKGVVINAHTGSGEELSSEEVRDMLDGLPVLAKIPHDEKVREAVAMKKPVVHHDPYSPASKAFEGLVSEIVPHKVDFGRKQGSIFERVANFFNF
ncbi:MAG: cell division ATPase MinD [Candidatus Aenigmatarchaeota archaeon]